MQINGPCQCYTNIYDVFWIKITVAFICRLNFTAVVVVVVLLLLYILLASLIHSALHACIPCIFHLIHVFLNTVVYLA